MEKITKNLKALFIRVWREKNDLCLKNNLTKIQKNSESGSGRYFFPIDGKENVLISPGHTIGYMSDRPVNLPAYGTLTISPAEEYSFFIMDSIMTKIKLIG